LTAPDPHAHAHTLPPQPPDNKPTHSRCRPMRTVAAPATPRPRPRPVDVRVCVGTVDADRGDPDTDSSGECDAYVRTTDRRCVRATERRHRPHVRALANNDTEPGRYRRRGAARTLQSRIRVTTRPRRSAFPRGLHRPRWVARGRCRRRSAADSRPASA
jgi:hypothetical protein